MTLTSKLLTSLADGLTEVQSLDDPVQWFEDTLKVKKLYPKQVDMIEAIKNHSQVSVCGCNSSGKDYTAARIALWWAKRYEPSKVIITAPSHRQIKDVIWTEVRSAYNSTLGGQIYETPYVKWGDEHFIVGFSTDRPWNLQGFHSPNLLLIISEAHGMKQAHVDALWRLNPKHILLTGNPLSSSGEFYDSQHSKADLWHTINIDAYDTPNIIEGREVIPGLVTLADIERARQNWGEDTPLFRTTFLNEWVENMGELIVVPLSLARQAQETDLDLGKIEVVACDVARYGDDKTVIYSRKGGVVRLVWEAQGFDLMQTVGMLKAYHDDNRHCHIVVDETGIGSGVVDRLREQGIGVIGFQGGAAAEDSGKFVNRVAEVWWRMREAYQKGLDTEVDNELLAQVSSRRYTIQSDRRIKLESKDDMRKEGRKSPDKGDALSMTFALYWQDLKFTAGSDVKRDEVDLVKAEHDDIPVVDYTKPTIVRQKSSLAGYRRSRWSKLRR